MLVAATNPCACGHAPAPRCRCTDADLARHARRLSGPLLDRLDLVLNVQRPAAQDLAAPAPTTSAAERERVMAARERQGERLRGTGAACNAQMDSALLRAHALADAGGRDDAARRLPPRPPQRARARPGAARRADRRRPGRGRARRARARRHGARLPPRAGPRRRGRRMSLHACDACLRRTWLVARLARRDRDRAPREADPARAARAARRAAHRRARRRAAPATSPSRARAPRPAPDAGRARPRSGLAAVCRHDPALPAAPPRPARRPRRPLRRRGGRPARPPRAPRGRHAPRRRARGLDRRRAPGVARGQRDRPRARARDRRRRRRGRQRDGARDRQRGPRRRARRGRRHGRRARRRRRRRRIPPSKRALYRRIVEHGCVGLGDAARASRRSAGASRPATARSRRSGA